jgi:iron complex outermembrane receptor protein
VPISVTALSGKDLAKSGVRGVRDLQTVAPSFQMSGTGPFTQLAVRGITSTTLGPGIENNVAVYYDGFYEPDSPSLDADLTNITSVEVLKGPQGTLYGRNATGGALLVNTYEPSLSHPIIEAGAQYGNYNDHRIHAYVGVPLTSTIAFGVGANYHANDGYVKNIDGTNAALLSETEVRAKLKWDPISNLDIVIGHNYFYKSDPLMNTNYVVAYSPYGLPVGPLFTNKVDTISQNPNPVVTVQLQETTFKARWDSGFGVFTDHMSYTDERSEFDEDYDGTYLNIQQIPSAFERHTLIEQLDYEVKPTATLDIQAGAFY